MAEEARPMDIAGRKLMIAIPAYDGKLNIKTSFALADLVVKASKFGVQLFVSEVPMSDFRCGIASDIAEDLFATYSQQAQEIVSHVMVEQQSRFIEVMKSISHCCGVDDVGIDDNTGETKTKKRKIYDTTIQKAKEMCDTFKGFNLSGDPDLEEARASLERALNGVTAEDIRESDAVRHAVKEDIDDILGKFSAFKCV